MQQKEGTFGITIIIPAYQAGEYLVKAVDSVKRHPIMIPSEIIVVDDGNTDYETREALTECVTRYDIKLLRNARNEGANFARNKAIRAGKFRYVVNLDADDLLNNDPALMANGSYMDQGVALLETDPNIAFAHCSTRMFGEFSGYTTSCFPLNEKLVAKKYHVPNSIIFRQVDAIQAGLYDKQVVKWMDWSFGVGILNARQKQGLQNQIKYINTPFYLYRVYTSERRVSFRTASELEMVRITVERNLDFFRKHYPNQNSDTIAELVLAEKPDTLKNLVHIANNDIELAMQVAKERGYAVISGIDSNKVP